MCQYKVFVSCNKDSDNLRSVVFRWKQFLLAWFISSCSHSKSVFNRLTSYEVLLFQITNYLSTKHRNPVWELAVSGLLFCFPKSLNRNYSTNYIPCCLLSSDTSSHISFCKCYKVTQLRCIVCSFAKFLPLQKVVQISVEFWFREN